MSEAKLVEPLDVSKPHSTVECNLQASPWHPRCVWNGVSHNEGTEICANGESYVCTNGVWNCQHKRC
jgi:hypothetical protein